MTLTKAQTTNAALDAYTPREWTLDNRAAFQAEMRRRSDFHESLPADYELGQSKLESYHATRRACAFIAAFVLTLSAALVLVKLFVEKP